MAQEFAKAFYNSAMWLACRAAYIRSVFGLCEICGDPGLILHHKIALTPDNIHNPDITLNWEYLQYTCLRCHNQITFGGAPLRDDVKFDENGNLVRR